MIIKPTKNKWHAAHQSILFGVDMPFYGKLFTSVLNVNGIAVFVYQNSGVTYPTFATRFYIKDGIYKGFHNVLSYNTTTFEITTDTVFIATDTRTLNFVIPFGYKVYYGYPTQTNTITLTAYHKFDGTAIVNVGEVLKSVFKIAPPIDGYDENMYTHFRIDIIPLGASIGLLSGQGLTMQTLTGWNYLTEIYYLLNSAIQHKELQKLVTYNRWISEAQPIYFCDCCNIMTRIINNRAFNLLNCPPKEIGIGIMKIDKDFQIK